MSFRDLGIIELTVFAALIAAFLLFFILFVVLRHKKQASNNRKLLRKRAMMEEAVQKKVRHVSEKPVRSSLDGEMAMREAFGEEFAEETDFGESMVQSSRTATELSAGGQDAYKQESLRMWDNNSKTMRTAKRSQQDSPFFVEERRISHRRDQLKRMEEAK